MVPESAQKSSFEHDDEEFSAPPEPEQIWPPPDSVSKIKTKKAVRLDEPTFSRDPELAWEDEIEKISEAIDEIRHLDETGEADQVETEAECELEADDEFEVLSIPSPQADVGGIVAGKAPVVFKPTIGSGVQPHDYETTRKASLSIRRVNEAAEGEIAQLWTNVFLSGERAAPRSIIVTASRRGDGATQIACSLAIIGAEANPDMRIALVDLNLRSPDVATVFGIRAEPGVVDLLDGRATIEQAVQTVPLSGGCSLYVISAGQTPPHPLSVIKSRQMQALVARIREQFDHVIFDVASSDAYPDAQVIGTIVDGALLVVSGGSTPRETVAEAKKRLDLARVRSLGLVLNQRNDPIPELLYKMA